MMQPPEPVSVRRLDLGSQKRVRGQVGLHSGENQGRGVKPWEQGPLDVCPLDSSTSPPKDCWESNNRKLLRPLHHVQAS